MNDGVAELLVLALRALFELLVPHSLGQTAREILIALCLTGAVWLVKHVQAVTSRRVTRARVTTAAAPA